MSEFSAVPCKMEDAPATQVRSASFCFRMGFLLLLMFVLVACGGTISTNQPRVLVSIAIEPNSAIAVKQRHVAFSVTGTFNQTPIRKANLTAAWDSSDPTIATIDPATGLAGCVAVGGPVTISASVNSHGSLKKASANLSCTPWATIPLGSCLVDSNNALTGQCAATQVFNNNCSVSTDSIACVAGQPSISTQVASCGSGARVTNVTVDISTACK